MSLADIGFFGNVWVKQGKFDLPGELHYGVKHHFNHIMILVSGTIDIEVEEKTKRFTGPAFIVMRKEHEHRITSVSKDVVYYSIFALRDINGEIMDIYGPEHDPRSYSGII